MDQLGAIETAPGNLRFGVFLPGLSPANTTSVSVSVITEADEILREIAAVSVALTHSANPTYGDYWSGGLTLTNYPAVAGSSWGAAGTYLYWFAVTLASGQVIDRLIDPFAREFGFQDCSAITVGYKARPWAASEVPWRTPPLSEIIVSEIELNEFAGSLAASEAMLPYLQSLGVTAVEVMPVTNVSTVIDWGYSPIGYFGVDERFGNRANFQAFVERAHACGMAVIVDMVYGHTDVRFLYCRVYDEAGMPNPVMDPQGTYGPTPRYDNPLMGDLFYTVNEFWLSTYHVDGLRYDNVDGFWDGQAGSGYYPSLTEATYRLVAAAVAGPGVSPDWQRFSPNGGAEIPLIQCAEYLPDPPAVLNGTFTNCTWQNGTLAAAVQAAGGGSLYALGLQSGLSGYPTSQTMNGVTLTKSAMQYIENHDHQRFVCNFGLHVTDVLQTSILQEGNRTDGTDAGGSAYVGQWFAVQPYLVLAILGKGIPFLWQAQEIGENYYVPEDWRENARVRLFRPIRWELANDLAGVGLTRLVRQLIQIRKNGAQFKSGDHEFVNDYANYQSKGLLLFSRTLGSKTSLVALNFTATEQSASYVFATSGDYAEEIDGVTMTGVQSGVPRAFSVPSHYGRVWTSP
jgi:glycosidase